MVTAPRRRLWPFVLGGLIAVIVLIAVLFRWDWLIPVVQTRASAALGPPVTITHLHVSLGRTTRIEVDGIGVLENPVG